MVFGATRGAAKKKRHVRLQEEQLQIAGTKGEMIVTYLFIYLFIVLSGVFSVTLQRGSINLSNEYVVTECKGHTIYEMPTTPNSQAVMLLLFLYL